MAELVLTNALTGKTQRRVARALNTLLISKRHLATQQEEVRKVLASSPFGLRSEETRLIGLLTAEADDARRATLEQLLALNRTRQQDHAALSQSADRLRLQQEVITQTFVSLRGSLPRARLSQQEAVGTGPPFQGEATETQARDVQEVVARLQQARSLEAATHELSALR